MDDGIELNFAAPSSNGVKRQLQPKKGGRWTDRVKQQQAVRRVVKKYEGGSNSSPKAAASSRTQPDLSVEKPAPRAAPAPQPRAAPAPVSKPAPAPRPAAPKAAPPPARPPPSSEAGPSRLPMDVLAPKPVAAPAKPAAPQIVSSLFTAAPLPYVKPSSAPVLGAPSNAPLVGDTSTFKGLGLDPLLCHHLQNKMNIKAPTGIQKSCLPYMISNPLNADARREEDDEGNALPITEDPGLRDVFIQSQTGSGKTLSFLLPIIHNLLPLSRLSYIDRSIGTLAIILAPTRELAQQISKVLESILTMSLSLPDEEEDRGYSRWLVSGLLVGGSTRTHEKAKLRKGVPILVSTPGRLLDHLQNTAAFQCAKSLFFVMDEADRLMDLGFEETIQGILKAMDGRRRNEINGEKEMDQEGGGLMRWPYWGRGRTTVLCSATVDAKVERLAGMALRNPVTFRSTDVIKSAAAKAKDAETEAAVADAVAAASAVTIPDAGEKFTPPSQLSQKYVVTPTKLRLVTLVALLRSLVGSAGKVSVDENDGTKIIVFLSSTDAVDYHFRLLGGVSMGAPQPEEESDSDDSDDDEDGKESADDSDDSDAPKQAKPKKVKKKKAKIANADLITLESSLFPNTTIQRLHGSLPLRTRMASLKAFATPSPNASILLATSVASRGLDLPLVRAVVQYDLPTEGGANEYVHRVGRTARAGKGGEAWAMVAPSEAEWIPWVEAKMGAAAGETVGEDGGSVRLGQVGVDEVLRKGFGGRGHEYEARATDVQLAFERWVLADDSNATLARKAFGSWVRAYSTHPLEERRFFHVKGLHLGHLAKAFALREAPGALAAAAGRPKKEKENKGGTHVGAGKRKRAAGADSDDDDEGERRGGKESTARNETERRMYEAVRKQGRLVKSGGALGSYSGAKGRAAPAPGAGGDFQVLDTNALAKLVAKRK